MKKIIIGTIVAVLLLLVGRQFITIKSGSPQSSLSSQDADLILFWGQGCPHCEKVKDYIIEKQLDSKVKILQKEVYNDRANQLEMQGYAKRCPDIDQSNGLGVPFAWINSEQKCLIGDTPIISWLNTKAGINQ